jgi:HEAT repeat protein
VRHRPVGRRLGPRGGRQPRHLEERDLTSADARRDAALAGHRGDADAARTALEHGDPKVRATALRAVARVGSLSEADLRRALGDADPIVRRGACEVAAAAATAVVAAPRAVTTEAVIPLLDDPDPGVVEVAAWALGEIATAAADPAGAGSGLAVAVAGLSRVAVHHEDPLVREAAVAALGAIGDPVGLPAILAGTRDKPAVRRRAVLALAPFDGPEVEAALEVARSDRDWQVRDAAELLRSDDR